MNFERYPSILHNRRERKPRFVNIFIFGFIVFLTLILILNIYNPSLVPSEFRLISLNKKVNILLLGCDEVFPNESEANGNALWKGRSDTIIVVNCNPFKNSINALNIPRDTRIRIPRHGIEKLNYLNSVLGPKLTKRHMENLLKVRIDHYVVINVRGLSRVIDELGGIEIDVPQRMQYTDRSANLYINLFPGKQILNGEQAVGFVRFRHDNLGDIGRIQRQQAFMRAVLTKLLDPVTFTKIPQIVSIYKKTILTDMRPKDILKIANFIRNVPPPNQNIVILPGEFGQQRNVSYWIPNQKEINKIIRKLFYDETKFFRYMKVDPKDIKVSVFNASHKDRGLATKIADILREYGYTILLIQDYESYLAKSRVYAQKANKEIALQVKYDIGNVGDILIGNMGPPEADVTILAGEDLANSKLKLHRKKK